MRGAEVQSEKYSLNVFYKQSVKPAGTHWQYWTSCQHKELSCNSLSSLHFIAAVPPSQPPWYKFIKSNPPPASFCTNQFCACLLPFLHPQLSLFTCTHVTIYCYWQYIKKIITLNQTLPNVTLYCDYFYLWLYFCRSPSHPDKLSSTSTTSHPPLYFIPDIHRVITNFAGHFYLYYTPFTLHLTLLSAATNVTAPDLDFWCHLLHWSDHGARVTPSLSQLQCPSLLP